MKTLADFVDPPPPPFYRSLTAPGVADRQRSEDDQVADIYFCARDLTKLWVHRILASEPGGDGGEYDEPVISCDALHINPGCAAVGSTIYVCGGGSGRLHFFDTNNIQQGWKEASSMKHGGMYPLAIPGNDGKLYVLSGDKYSRTEIFDPSSGKWEQRDDPYVIPYSKICSQAVCPGKDRVLLWSPDTEQLLSYNLSNGEVDVCHGMELGRGSFSQAVLGNVLYSAGFDFELIEFQLVGYFNYTNPPVLVTFENPNPGDFALPLPNPGYAVRDNVFCYPTVRLLASGKNELALIWLDLRDTDADTIYCLRMKMVTVADGERIQLVAHPLSISSQKVASSYINSKNFIPVYRGSGSQQKESNSGVVKDIELDAKNKIG